MTTRSWIRTELKNNYEKASRTAREAARTEPRAVEARYMPASRQLRVRLTNGASLSLPVSIIPELRKATPAQLTGIEILPGGDGLHWEAIDFTISVPGLVASLFGRSGLFSSRTLTPCLWRRRQYYCMCLNWGSFNGWGASVRLMWTYV